MRTLLSLSVILGVACTEYDVGQGTDPNTGEDDDTGEIIVDPGAPDILVEPLNLGFGTRPVDCAADDQTVTVTNVGEELLTVDGLELLGAGAGSFSLLGSPIDLASGESFTFDVGFVPNAETTFIAAVRVTSNDPDESTVDVSLEGSGGENATNADIFDQGLPEAVDVLWVLDNSCSMSDKVSALENSMDDFIQNFVDIGLDYQMGVTTTDLDGEPVALPNVDDDGDNIVDEAGEWSSYTNSPNGTDDDGDGRIDEGFGLLLGDTKVMASANMTNAEVVAAFDAAVDPNSAGSADERPLEAAQTTLETNSTGYALAEGLVRPNANLSIIVLTDEEDGSGGTVASWTSWVDGLKPATNMSNISGLISGISASSPFAGGCASISTGSKLEDVIRNTGGFAADICQIVDSNQTAVNNLLDWLSFTAAGLLTSFELSDVPTSLSQIRVTVDGQSVSYSVLNGWSYDADTNTVIFYGDSIPPAGSQVVITYPVESECL